MVLEKLGDSLKATLEKVTKALFVDEKLINELVKDIQRALLQADVNVKLVFALTQRIKERALKEDKDIPKNLSKKEYLIKVVYEELVVFLGGEGPKIDIQKRPFTIMLVGLFGNGKTTTAAKLGKFYATRGKSVALISTDTWRPAAYIQLKQLGDSLGLPVFGNPQLKDPVAIHKSFEKQLKDHDVIIVDTAGRDALNEELIEELNSIRKGIASDETLLVMSADVGQAAQSQAQVFHDTCHVTGVIVTKMDGTAKGGGALSACAVTGAPVKFIGVGEKTDAFEEFRPERFVGRLLGMGDLETLLEKAREAITEEDAEDLGKRFLKGEFNLIDLYEQMQAMKKMGPLSKIVEMIPGMSGMKLPKEALETQQEKLELWKIAMDSMNRRELEDPEVLDGQRIGRISRGAGIEEQDIRDLLKQYRQAKKLVKMMKGNDKKMQKMMKQMQSGGMPGGMGMKF